MAKKSEADLICERETKKLHGELYAEGIRNKDIAVWLHCSEQNVSQLWKRCSFSYKQILIIQTQLERIKDR